MKHAAMLFPLLAAFAGSSVVAQNGSFQDLFAIDRAVSAFVGGTPGIQDARIRPVDRRLRLKPCPAPLVLAWHGDAQNTVRVHCPEPEGWRLFVPIVDMAASAPRDSAPLISKGDPVTIRITGRGFAVTAIGEALEQGRAKEWIRIRPFGAKTQLRGQVQGAGLVTVVQS